MWLPPEGWLLVIVFISFLIGYNMGYSSGEAAGRVKTLEHAYIVDEDKENNE